jgi:AraC-like DNA-binding protein
MSYNHTWYLHRGPLVRIRDFACSAPRSGIGRERTATADHLLFTRRGVFLKHPATSTGSVTAEPVHVLLYNEGEAFRTSHPAGGGDEGTVFAFDAEAGREVMRQFDRSSWPDRAPLFGVGHIMPSPGVLLRAFRLRRRIARQLASPLEIEEEALGILAALGGEVARVRSSRPVRVRRRARARRRDDVETVKQLLASDPGREMSLDELASVVSRSPFHLTSLFREETGLPIHRYHLRLRATLALDRLDSTSSLSAIGFDLGLTSHSHFTAMFRRVFEMTPSAARRFLDSEPVPMQPGAIFIGARGKA